MERLVVLDCPGLVGPAKELDFVLLEEAADVLIMVAARVGMCYGKIKLAATWKVTVRRGKIGAEEVSSRLSQKFSDKCENRDQ